MFHKANRCIWSENLNSVQDPLLTQPTHFVHGSYCIMSEVSWMLKETSKPSCCQVIKKRVLCIISLCWIKLSSFPNIRGLSFVSYPFHVLWQFSTKPTKTFAEAMTRPCQWTSDFNVQSLETDVSPNEGPKTFLLKMVSRSCKWIYFGAMDFETHPTFPISTFWIMKVIARKQENWTMTHPTKQLRPGLNLWINMTSNVCQCQSLAWNAAFLAHIQPWIPTRSRPGKSKGPAIVHGLGHRSLPPPKNGWVPREVWRLSGQYGS